MGKEGRNDGRCCCASNGKSVERHICIPFAGNYILQESGFIIKESEVAEYEQIE